MEGAVCSIKESLDFVEYETANERLASKATGYVALQTLRDSLCCLTARQRLECGVSRRYRSIKQKAPFIRSHA